MSWYQSFVPKECIIQISIDTTLPNMDWDEQWWSDELSAHCARWGSQLYVAGENISVQPALFECFLSVKKIVGLELLDSSNSKDLSRIFAGCASLGAVDLSSWNTSSVLTVEGLFEGCISLKEANLSTWDLSECRSVAAMFRECNHLQALDVGQWDVAQVEDFSNAFSCCYALKTLDVSRWNTGSALTMEGLFNRCTSLEVLDVSRWNMDQVTNCSFLFHRCERVKKLDLKHWNLRKDAEFRNMFLRMFGTIILPRQRRFRTLLARDSWIRSYLRADQLCRIASVEFTKRAEVLSWYDACWAVDEAESGFLFCIKQGDRLIICSRGDSIYTNEDSCMLFCFPDAHGKSWLREIDGLELLNTRYTRDFSFMFSGNGGLVHLNLKNFDFSCAKNLTGMFLNCSSLQSVDDSVWQLPANAEQQGMYQGCSKLNVLRIMK